jgi:hypothetical protein
MYSNINSNRRFSCGRRNINNNSNCHRHGNVCGGIICSSDAPFAYDTGITAIQ